MGKLNFKNIPHCGRVASQKKPNRFCTENINRHISGTHQTRIPLFLFYSSTTELHWNRKKWILMSTIINVLTENFFNIPMLPNDIFARSIIFMKISFQKIISIFILWFFSFSWMIIFFSCWKFYKSKFFNLLGMFPLVCAFGCWIFLIFFWR